RITTIYTLGVLVEALASPNANARARARRRCSANIRVGVWRASSPFAGPPLLCRERSRHSLASRAYVQPHSIRSITDAPTGSLTQTSRGEQIDSASLRAR